MSTYLNSTFNNKLFNDGDEIVIVVIEGIEYEI